MAKSLGIKVEEKNINYKDIENFDAMFISGTSPKILPISSVDNIQLRIDNEIMQVLIKEFNEEIKKYVNKSKK